MTNVFKLFILNLAYICASTQADDIRPELDIAIHVFPPFQYKKNGETVGPFVKILNLICDDAKIKCNVEIGPYRDQYAKVVAGEADIIATFLIDKDEERNKLFILSPPIVDTKYSFFTTSTSTWTWTGNPRDLDGRTIGVYGPSGTSIIAKRLVDLNPSSSLVLEPTNLVAFQQLVIGKYGIKAAIVVNKDLGLAYLKNSNIYGPRLAGDITDVSFGLGFSRASKHVALAPIIMKSIDNLKNNGLIANALKENDPPLVPSK